MGALWAVLALLLVACNSETATTALPATAGSSESASSATAAAGNRDARPASPGDTPAPAPGSATQPLDGAAGAVDVDRAFEHIEVLAVDIGIRAAGTEAEQQAARYIRDVLEDAGYATEIEPFSFSARYDESAVSLPGETLRAFALEGSAQAAVTQSLVEAGTGQAEEIAAARVAGLVVVVSRGVIPFAEKVANAEAHGAAGLIIVNNEQGPFRGTLGSQQASIPVVAVSGSSTAALTEALGQQITVTASMGSRMVDSENVVARNGECLAYVGGHYDSVVGSPGANDNASGTAVVLELARVHRVEGLCFILFGAEEVGLRGSQAFVSEHLVGNARFMLNIDMAGRVDDPILVGDDDLTRRILDALGDRFVPLRAGAFPPWASSDHVSFLSVGVPAVTITSGHDEMINTPGDDITRIERDSLAFMLGASDAALAGLIRTLME